MKSTRRTAYIVQAFWPLKGGVMKGQPHRLESKPQALRYGAELATQAPGVIVFAMEVDETVDYCGEPRLLATYGEVPDLAA